MSDAIATAITAAAGLGGALLGAMLPQRYNARERAAEAELADRRRSFEERREAYTAMNRASEQFHTLLKDALQRMRDGIYTEEDRSRLEDSRREYRDHYAAAQMIVPLRIMEASRELNKVLAGVDAAAKRIDRGFARDGESAERLLIEVKQAEPRMVTMRTLMREDLGIRD
ncbi:hypothetical protein [Streptomyces morookaense]|uniref:Uncharacterized protein n=1 Tax=Streptomyces morookaense TaxID=1970 RepID=A0A7Y7B281_STRMO|nr:hypothetical protein [Streptomyces morookaense]NVK77678.1 hypothetical protein [Streptomyces morookaense]GHF05368.1 hypothetical protein GCM10010359_02920 [Streptomyces morookaense]